MSLFNSLLMMIVGATQAELARQVRYLKIENETLRSKLPARIVVTPQERKRLLKFGAKMGKAIRQLVTIVTPDTFLRWIREDRRANRPGAEPAKRGRPRTRAQLRQLILRMARDNEWGYTRIVGELKKLGIQSIKKSTVRNILNAAGIDPCPKRAGAVRAPNTRAFVERFIGTVRRECLNHFLFFGTRHLDSVLKTWLSFYLSKRPHQGKDNELLTGKSRITKFKSAAIADSISLRDVRCAQQLGGLLRSYSRKAA